jgi:hypothetical protein
MNRLFKLQFLGPLTLFLATASAELAARARERAPSSATLWYLNLKVFGLFQRSHEVLGEYVDVNGFQLFGIALPIFALACVGLMMRSRLPLAVSSQFAVGYAVFLLFSWQGPTPLTAHASLRVISVPSGEGFYMLTGIVGACVLSCIISHLLYLRAGRALV